MKLLGPKEYASLENIRCIWEAVSVDPRITIRRLSANTEISIGQVNDILKFLEACGYIEHDKRRSGHRVLIPLVPGTMVHHVKWTAPQIEIQTAHREDLSQ